MKDKKNWENLAEIDAKWAILSHAKAKYNKWDENEFLSSGEEEINYILTREFLDDINYEAALDFGCGIGRLTKPLGKRFLTVKGVDISEKMIAVAKKSNHNQNIEYILNFKNDLSIFQDNTFSLIYSAITLQHISDKKIIEKFLSEFIRIVKPQGYIIFSLPTVKAYSFLKEKLLAFRGYIFNFLILLCSPNYIYTFLKISPYMKMNSLTSKRVINIYNKEADLLETELPGTINTRYFFKKKKLKANE